MWNMSALHFWNKKTTDHVIELYFEGVRNSCFFPDDLTDISVYEHSTKGKCEEKYSYPFTEEDYNAAASLLN